MIFDSLSAIHGIGDIDAESWQQGFDSINSLVEPLYFRFS
jgi:hypothetical protein